MLISCKLQWGLPLAPFVSGRVKHVRRAAVRLHDELHDVRLVPLEWQIQAVDLNNGGEKLKELWYLLLVLAHQAHQALQLFGRHLQAGRLVPNKCLETGQSWIVNRERGKVGDSLVSECTGRMEIHGWYTRAYWIALIAGGISTDTWYQPLLILKYS